MDAEKRQRTEPELKRLLGEQLSFLESSAESYDRGFMGEAKRLATAIRVLVHDTKQSHSLLGQLNIKNKQFLDTAFEKKAGNKFTYGGLIATVLFKGDDKPKYRALLDEIPQSFRDKWVNFDDWWVTSIFVNQSDDITRKKIILIASNQDGGAHVDPALDVTYDKLMSGSFMAWEVHSAAGKSFIEDAASAAIRQIAHEVLKTLKPGYTKKPNMENVATMIANPSMIVHSAPMQVQCKPRKIGRNELCPCGSKKKYKRCCGL
jgi:hypothetical protein